MLPKLYSLLILIALFGLSLTYESPTDEDTDTDDEDTDTDTDDDDDDYESSVNDEVMKEWKALNKLTFKSGKTAHEPEETLKHFRRMIEIFPQISPSMDESSVNDWQGKKEIADIADISPDKCSPSELSDIDTTYMIYYNSKSISKLLDYLKGKQFAACKAKFDKEFQETLEGLQPSQKDDIVQLVSEVLKYDKGYGEADNVMPEFTFNGLTRGCLDFLKQRNPKLSKKTSRGDFKKLFDSSIMNSCETVSNQIAAPIEFYKQLLATTEKEVNRSIKQETFDWLIKDKICKRLTEDRKYHFNVAYETLRKLHKANKRLIDPRVIENMEQYKKEQKELDQKRKEADWDLPYFTCRTFFCLV